VGQCPFSEVQFVHTFFLRLQACGFQEYDRHFREVKAYIFTSEVAI